MGVNQTTGTYEFANKDGEPTAFPDVRPVNISFLPKYYGGLQNSITYKNIQLDLSFYFIKRIAEKYMNMVGSPGAFAGGLNNQTTDLLDRWQKPGDVTNTQKFSTSFSNFFPLFNLSSSDFGFEDASFIRLKNVSLSYDFPNSFIKKASLESLRIFFAAQNLFTITNYSGLDPETGNSRGILQ